MFPIPCGLMWFRRNLRAHGARHAPHAAALLRRAELR